MKKYRLEWTVDGVRHHSDYKSEAIAIACFQDCSECKRHSDVTLLEISPKVIMKSKTSPKLRIFATVHKVSDRNEKFNALDAVVEYYEISDVSKLPQFLERVNDSCVFSVTIYPSTIFPTFLRKKSVTLY